MTDSPLCSCAKPAGLTARPIRVNRKTDRQYLFSISLPPSNSFANQEGGDMVPFAGRAGKKTSIDAAPAVWAVIIFSVPGEHNVTAIALYILCLTILDHMTTTMRSTYYYVFIGSH